MFYTVPDKLEQEKTKKLASKDLVSLTIKVIASVFTQVTKEAGRQNQTKKTPKKTHSGLRENFGSSGEGFSEDFTMFSQPIVKSAHRF